MLINPHSQREGHRKAAEWVINAIFQSAGRAFATTAQINDWQTTGKRLWDIARTLIPQFIQNNQSIYLRLTKIQDLENNSTSFTHAQ